MVKKILLLVVLSVLFATSCYDYKGSFYKSNEYMDSAMDYFGDGVSVNAVLHTQNKMAWSVISKDGKNKDQLRDFMGYILDGGVLYIVLDCSKYGDKLPDNIMAEVQTFKKDWNEGQYKMWGRTVYPIWIVYGKNQEDMMRISGYYKGEGWHIYNANSGTIGDMFDASKLEEIDFAKYIPKLVTRAMNK